jgi:hypothetical protein
VVRDCVGRGRRLFGAGRDRQHRVPAQPGDRGDLLEEPGVPGAGLAAHPQRAGALDIEPGEEFVGGRHRGVALPQPGAGDFALGVRVVGDGAAAAAALGQVVAPVCGADEGLGIGPVLGEGGHAEADRQVQRRVVAELPRADLVGDPQRHPDRRRPVGVRQQQDELVAAVPEQRVIAPDQVLHPVYEMAEHLVAPQVAVRVVDGFEEVDIEEEEGERAGGPLGPLQLLGEPGQEEGARVGTGHRIGDRLVDRATCLGHSYLDASPGISRTTPGSAVRQAN